MLLLTHEEKLNLMRSLNWDYLDSHEDMLAVIEGKLESYLGENGIGTSIYYPIPLHLQKCFEYLGYRKGDFPVAEKLCGAVLALPMFPELTEGEVDFICDTVKKFYKCCC